MTRNKKICDKCDKKISMSNFKRHINSCTKIKKLVTLDENWRTTEGKYKCPLCYKDFSKFGISTHIKTAHFSVNASMKGKKSWNQGLTKETDSRVKQCSATLIKNFKNGKNIGNKGKIFIDQNEKNDLELYRYFTQFKFALKSFPDEYDFSLIAKHGWYKAKHCGDNQNGVSRDHIVSVRYGFDNNIATWIIAHPANCQLMPQTLNSSKNSKCDLTIDELLEKIEKWNKKYCG